MNKDLKIKGLIKRKDKYKAKLVDLYKNFHGVRHENSLSELRYSEIKVYEDLLNSVTVEINKLENEE